LRKLKIIPLFRSNSAVSYAISAILISSTIIVLVLVASIYAYQIIEQQRGTAEFNVVTKSIIAFNDALESVAWKPGATLSSRFTIQYGELRLIPDKSPYANNINVLATISSDGVERTLYSNTSSLVSYYIRTMYVTFGGPYQSYILGNESSLLVGSTGNYGRAVINQITGWVYITLDYRVRVMLSSTIKVNGIMTTYVDVWVIKIVLPKEIAGYQYYAYIHDFDLKARCLKVQATPYGPYDAASNSKVTFEVTVGNGNPSSSSIDLVTGKVVFNVIVAEVRVYI